MKIRIHIPGAQPLDVDTDRIWLVRGPDVFHVRARPDGLLMRLETHDDGLASEIAVIPNGSNGVLLRSPLR